MKGTQRRKLRSWPSGPPQFQSFSNERRSSLWVNTGFCLQWGLLDAGFTKVLLFTRLKDEKNNAQIQIKLQYLLLIQNNYFKLKSPREFVFVTS